MNEYVHPSILLPDMGSRLLGNRMPRAGAELLDIGGGSGVVGATQWVELGVSRIVVVDAWEGYLDQPRTGELHIMPAIEAFATFGPNSFDVVQCCETIEHMSREAGDLVLEDMKRMARLLVIMTCPHGFQEQDPSKVPDEPWAGNPFQLHVTGWMPADFERHGYAVSGNPHVGPGCQLVPYFVRP